tara:strand:- start:7637 stop:8941 length:1305 start_codon:yes stop_codon:yes gene_type:complete
MHTEHYAVHVENLSKHYSVLRNEKKPVGNNWKILKKQFLNPSTGNENYFTIKALDEISFSVDLGESIGIVGLNGSGKSTLLQIISGIVQPTSGLALTNGKTAALLELGSGFNPEFTGIENIFLNGNLYGLSSPEIKNKLHNILDFAGIGDFALQPVKSYSTGMFLRLAFAVIAHVDAEILIIDEALAVGDAFFQAKCFDFLNKFREQGKTLVIVSHDLNCIARLCCKCLLLNKGRQVAIGAPGEIINHYNKLITNGSEGYDSPPSSTLIKQNLAKDDKSSTGKSDKNWTYGDSRGEILSYEILNENGESSLNFYSGNKMTIIFDVIAYKKIKSPIFAIKLRDSKGQIIYGQNTKFMKFETGIMEINEKRRIIYNLNTNLAGGEYLLSLGFTTMTDGNLSVVHRKHDLVKILIINTDGSFGISNCYAGVSMSVIK